jgi:AraC-like DNA-binding protein
MSERLFLRLDGDTLYAPETSVPADTMRDYAVSAALREHVSAIAVYRETIPNGHEVVERVLPDGAVHLIFHFGDAPSVDAADAPVAAAAGATAAPVVLRWRGQVAGVSVTLRPGAAAAILGVPAGEIADTAVSLDELWRGEVRGLLERWSETADDATRVALLQAALQRRLRAGDDGARPQATHAARLIAASGGQRSLRAVGDAIGVGERRLQQIFHAHVGLSPRAWKRLARMHACLRALRRQPAPRWPHVALDTGFYDQSHLVNEFQALCGLSPGLFLERAISGSSKTSC